MPDETFEAIAHGVGFWLRSVAKVLTERRSVFVELCGRILDIPTEDGVDTQDAITRAINHPVGYVVEGLITLWFRDELNDGDLMPDWLAPTLTRVCDPAIERYRHGRVILASRLISLFRIDVNWTANYLLPLFRWSENPFDAPSVWQGFLWSPRLYRPLVVAFKQDLLETVHHLSMLGEHARQFVTFLTYAALDPSDTFTHEELENAIAQFRQVDLEHVTESIARAIESAGDQRENYWANRVEPFWRTLWPKDRDLLSDGLSSDVARIVIAAWEKFPEALGTLGAWLQPIEHPHYVFHLLVQSDLGKRFPRESLDLIDRIVGPHLWATVEYSSCLRQIVEAAPALGNDARYRRLLALERQSRG